MTSWLKRLGTDALQIGAALVGLAPLVQPLAAVPGEIGTVASDFGTLTTLVQQVETIGASTSLTGEQKLVALTALAAPYIKKAIATSPGTTAAVTDAANFGAKAQTFLSAYVDLLQAVEPTPAPAKVA